MYPEEDEGWGGMFGPSSVYWRRKKKENRIGKKILRGIVRGGVVKVNYSNNTHCRKRRKLGAERIVETTPHPVIITSGD